MLKVFLLTAALFLLQAPDDTPEADKPMQCDNYVQTPAAHRCHCARDQQQCQGLPEPPAPVAMDRKCLTYCREQHCECRGHACRS